MKISSILKWLGIVLLGFCVCFIILPLCLLGMLSLASGDLAKSQPTGDYPVAVIELTGVIEDTSDEVAELYKQAHSDAVKGIVLRIDSVGGAVGPSQELYFAVQKLKEKKPIVASMGTVAASGGLYAALGASKIFSMPGTVTGSIGVIMQIPNVRKIADQLGFEMVTIRSGELKDAGNPFREMTAKERSYFNATIDIAHEDFLKAVVESRGIEEARAREFADGRVILGSQALEYGLVDQLGGLQEAARAALELSGASLAEDSLPDLFYPLGQMNLLREILAASQGWIGRLSADLRLLYILN